MKRIALLTTFVGFAALLSCSGSAGTDGYSSGNPTGPVNSSCPDNTLCMRASIFQPTSVTVARGTAVSFQNSSGVDHNIIFDAPPAGVTDIGLISSGTQTRTFGTAGSFALHCTIHAGMNATVVVQ